ncbi:MAG: alanine/glycine:cation symporter family protein [Bacteroidota bacterium]|nr:alanine/glycine:cation symporter family protein [Bacteroidota bacterium]
MINLNKSFLFPVLIILFSIPDFSYSSNNKIDTLEFLCREFSYSSIDGLEIDISDSDYFKLEKNGSFKYIVSEKNASGNWSLQTTRDNSFLVLDYSTPQDTIRAFKIDILNKNVFTLSENEYTFIFEHKFSNKINSLSNSINSMFEPLVLSIASVVFFDISKIFGSNDNIPFIVIWLVFGALFFTIRMGFVNIKGFKHAIMLVKGDYDDPNNKGEVSHFQALTTALSGTVGLGNIAGVAIAISLGGPGATFWMIVAGLLGMSSKFVECTLGVKYRQIDDDGTVHGGPMYYLRDGLEKKNFKNLGKFLAVLFALLCIGGSVGGGNMFQANQAFSALKGIFPSIANYGPLFGIFFSILVGIVIIGGIKSIAMVTERIVPLMAAVYVGASLVIILLNFSEIGFVVSEIISGAFTPKAGFGGIVGVLIIGFKRAAFSNEAGVGSASIAHSAAKTKEPVSEGMVALLEPFIDTVVICTMTAFVIIITGNYENVDGLGGSELTAQAFGSVISWFPYILTIAILLFAFSTMISWSYYGLKSWTFLFGKSKVSELSYKLMFMLFIVVGSSVSLGAVVDFSDMMILAMAFPNIIGLLIMSGEVRSDLKDYFKKITSGEIKKYK